MDGILMDAWNYSKASATQIDYSTGSLAVTALALLTLYCWPIWNRHRYPPGPIPIPFLGHIPWFFFGKNPMEWVDGLKKKYGEVVTIDLSISRKAVILNSAEAMYEGFVKQADKLSSRPPSNGFPLTGGKGMVGEADGRWQPQRRHALAVFKGHGIGRKGIEPVINEELHHFLAALDKTESKPFYPKDLLVQSISNVITNVIFGNRFDYSDEMLGNLQFQDWIAVNHKVRAMPLLKYLPFDLISFHRHSKDAMNGVNFCREQIEKHEEDIDYDGPARDYVDSYLMKMREEKTDPNTAFNLENFSSNVVQLYIAGTDTTTNQLYWAFLYMVLYPEMQERVYQEIKQHIGERKATYADRNFIPYTLAVTTEIMRMGSVLTNTVPHYSSEDVNVLGHIIPKGTMVQGNIWGILHDERTYPDSQTFKPERFLDEEGNYVKPDSKQYVPFGIGRRACLGEHLARAEYFMFLTATLQKFKLELGQDKRPSGKGKRHFVYIPEEGKYQIKCIPR